MYIKYIQGLCQSRLSTADSALFLVASATTAEKHVPAATNTQATIELYLETMFSIPSVQSGFK
jgi:hypothetical protein